MPKKETEEMIVEDAIVEDTIVDERQGAWLAFLEKYAVANPVKFAEKKAKGEFDVIPSDFK